MDFLKKTFGIDLKMIEHRNWTIRIVSTVLWLLAISIMGEKFDDRSYELTDLDSMINFYIFAYMFGMFLWGSINFNKVLVDAPSPKPENSIYFDLHERVNWLMDMTEKYSGTGYMDELNLLKELNHLKDKYESELKNLDIDRKELKKVRKENAKSEERVSNVRFKGPKANNIVCPHCQTKGDVHKTRRELTEESRERGVIGATIGRKTITKKGSVTELYCSNCDVTWQV